MGAKSHDVGTRVQALALVEYGVPTKLVSELTGISIRSINGLKHTARRRGFDPEKSRVLLIEYVVDAPRSGRPKKITEEKEEEVVARAKKDHYGGEMSTAELGAQFKLSKVLNFLLTSSRRSFRSSPYGTVQQDQSIDISITPIDTDTDARYSHLISPRLPGQRKALQHPLHRLQQPTLESLHNTMKNDRWDTNVTIALQPITQSPHVVIEKLNGQT